MQHDILIIDDEEDIRNLLSDILRDEGYTTRVVKNGTLGLKCIREKKPSLVILDVWLGHNELDGLEILKKIKQIYSFLPVVMISGHSTIEKAVQALKIGAQDFIEKPFQIEKLLHVIQRTIDLSSLNSRFANQDDTDMSSVVLQGVSPYVSMLKNQINDAAQHDKTVILHGPSKSGQDMVAKLIHAHSQRSKNPICILNMDASPQTEKKLFGLSLKNNEVHTGLLEHLHLGSLGLNDFSMLDHRMQQKIIYYIGTNQFSRLGDKEVAESSVRLFLMHQRPLVDCELWQELIAQDKVLFIHTKGLHERIDDIPAIVNYLISYRCHLLGMPIKRFDESLGIFFQSLNLNHHFYELQLIVDWMIFRAYEKDTLSYEDIPKELSNDVQEKGLNWLYLPIADARKEFEKTYLEFQLKKYNNNIKAVADSIGMERTALYRKIKLLGGEEG